MASMEIAAVCSKFPFYCKQPRFSQVIAMRQLNSLVSATNRTTSCAAAYDGWGCGFRRLSLLSGGDFRHLSWPSFAVEQGYEASIAEKKKKDDISLTDVNVVIESRDDDKIHVRVDLTGEQTQKAFDDVLTNLARTAPPIPGFRRTKGGKTSNVPKSFLLQILGKDRVTKFLLEEIVSISIGDYVKKENLKVKSQFKTTQTAQELESAFVPGGKFSFNATMEIEKAEAETTSSSST